MIVDKIENGGQYAALHPNFKAAFDYLSSTNLLSLEIGKFDIAEGLRGIVSDKDGVTGTSPF